MKKLKYGIAVAVLAGVLAVGTTGSMAQTLTIGVRAGPESIDPHFTATGTHAEALKHVFDTLTVVGAGLEIEPRLAESWKAIGADTWEFKLRKGVKFHDGSDFTAEDVKFSIERIPIVTGPNPTDHLRAPRAVDRRSSTRTPSASRPTGRRRTCRMISSACSSSRTRRQPA
jgi:peptide/nickel transport system substrate-binding protein